MSVLSLFGLLLLGALETDNQGNGHRQFLRGLDNTLSNVIATHDAAEDVDEDALDFGVGEQNLESLFDGFRSRTSTEQVRTRLRKR